MNTANHIVTVTAALAFGLGGSSANAWGSELKLYCTIAMRSVVEDLAPKFEKASGHKVTITFGLGGALAKRVQDGEIPDAIISTQAGIDSLLKSGKLVPGSNVTLARSGVGIAVRKGAPKPDISSAEALKATLLAAKSISYTNPSAGGASGVHFGKVIERLGLTEALKDKTKHPQAGGSTGKLLAQGEVDLAVQQISELIEVPGIELLGPLPGDLQNITVLDAGIPAGAKEQAAGAEFIKFVRSPEAVNAIKSKGLDPA
jgi:molybdate transport system substrate-binding protein